MRAELASWSEGKDIGGPKERRVVKKRQKMKRIFLPIKRATDRKRRFASEERDLISLKSTDEKKREVLEDSGGETGGSVSGRGKNELPNPQGEVLEQRGSTNDKRGHSS